MSALDRMLSVLLLTLQFAVHRAGAQLTNSVVEQPIVSCATDAVYAQVQDAADVQRASAMPRIGSAIKSWLRTIKSSSLFPILDCRISRTRSLDPPGLLLETTVLLNFHPDFVTEADRFFVLRCLHTRNATQNGGLNAGVPQPLTTFPTASQPAESEPPTAEVAAQPAGLRCSYVVVNEETNALVKSVRVGTPVRHEWKCEGTRPNSCLLVTNCYIKAVDTQFEVIDAYGCSKDRNLIAELDYANKDHVVQHAKVFGIADKPFVFYGCELNLVDAAADGSCPRPKCSTRVSRDVEQNETLALVPLFDVLSQQIEVLPLDVPSEWTEADAADEPAAFCVAWPVFFLGSLVISMMLIATGVLTTIVVLRRMPYHDVAQA
ncbi:hypothetical protein M3Y99_00836800 [Aphelenchoides fujianensis]|nr:hypothetical protein M3Y99_00836800 [Aphelenchoides fujianensis]